MDDLYVFSFGESEGDQWYIDDATGKKIKCDEETINLLLLLFNDDPTGKKHREGDYVVYTVTNPLILEQ